MEDIKLYQKCWLGHLENWTEAVGPKWLFSINSGDDGMLEDPGQNGIIKNALSFKGTDLKT
jgi:hypothetical protein